MTTIRLHPLALATAAACVLSACGGSGDVPVNVLPGGIGEVKVTRYDGGSDDLLTAGLGKAGLQSAVAPTFADALNPTAAELRRAAIYTSYRAIVDTTDAGGYGTLYGPNVNAAGVVTASDGKVLENKKLEQVFGFNGVFINRIDVIDRDPAPDEDEDEDDGDA